MALYHHALWIRAESARNPREGASRASPSASRSSSKRWPYTVGVKAAEAYPITCWTGFSLQPAATSERRQNVEARACPPSASRVRRGSAARLSADREYLLVVCAIALWPKRRPLLLSVCELADRRDAGSITDDEFEHAELDSPRLRAQGWLLPAGASR
jgi:hypothetical protein